MDRRAKGAFLISLSESNRTAFGRGEDFGEQTLPQKVFSAIWALESEVNNGGFSQYFFNNSRESAHFATEALNTIRAPKTAEICDRAIKAAFPTGLPSDCDLIRAAASDFDEETEEKLDALDREFFAYPSDLTELLFAYVCKHPEEFGEVPASQ